MTERNPARNRDRQDPKGKALRAIGFGVEDELSEIFKEQPILTIEDIAREKELALIGRQRQMVTTLHTRLVAATAPYDVRPKRDAVSSLEVRLNAAQLALQNAELLQRQELEATELSQKRREYKDLARNFILHGAVAFERPSSFVQKARTKDLNLDKAIANRPEAFRNACLDSYREGLGIIDEHAPPTVYEYLTKIVKGKRPEARIFDSIRGEDLITPAACYFLWAKTKFMSAERIANLEGFLLQPANNPRLRRNVEIAKGIIRVVNENDPKGRPLVSLEGLIPLYGEWIAGKFGSTEPS